MSIEDKSFAANLRRFRNTEAIVCDDGQRVSYFDLADSVADFVTRLGPQKRLILVEAANELPAVVAYLAALAGGHAVIMAAKASDKLIDTFRPDAIFRRDQAGWQLTLTPPEGGLHPDLAVLLSTSGTTGATKLVRLSRGAIEANAASIADYLDIGPGERAPTTLPIHYSYGLSVLNSHLANGGTLLLTGKSLLDEQLWDFVGREGGTSLAGVPYSYELLDRIGFWQRGLPTLRTLTQAGGRLPPADAARIGEWSRANGIRFFIMYGQTEATARMAYLPPERLVDAPDCIGIAIPGGTFELVGSDGPIDTAETEGELVYRGPNVMMGYALGRDDLARGAEIDALHTQDLAVRRADGLFRVTGRASRMAKPFGLRVSFDEIERQLAEQGIQAAVTGSDALISISVTGSLPRGFDGPKALGAQIAALLKLPESLFDVAAVAELPRLANGKTDYRALLAAAEARQQQSEMQPEGDGHGRIAAIFHRAFPVERLSRDASFVGMGGDSLSYVQVSIALEDVLGTLPEGWESMTIAELEALVKERPATKRSWLPRIDSEILLRALALLSMIANHASDYPVGGGSDLLMLLAGYSLARFQSGRLFAGQGFSIIRDYFIRIMIPYLAVLLLYAVFRKPVPVWNFLFVGNYLPTQGGLLTPFWFLDALFQLYLLCVFFCLLPGIRAAGRHHPFRLALGFVAVAFVVKFSALLLFPQIKDALANRTADASLALFAMGWLIWFAHSRRQKLITMGAALLLALPTAGLVPELAIWSHYHPMVGETRAVWLVASTAILLNLARIPIFAPLRAPIVSISGAGYHIYLVHGVVVFIVLTYAKWTPLVITIVSAILLGLLLKALSQGLSRTVSDGWRLVSTGAVHPRRLADS